MMNDNVRPYRAEEVIGENVKLLIPSPYHEARNGYFEYYRTTGEGEIIGIGRELGGHRR